MCKIVESPGGANADNHLFANVEDLSFLWIPAGTSVSTAMGEKEAP